MWGRFAPRLRRAIIRSHDDQRDLVETILNDRDSAAAILHARMRTAIETSRDEMMMLLARAVSEADWIGDQQVGTEHVLLAVAAERDRDRIVALLRAWRQAGAPRPSMQIGANVMARRPNESAVEHVGRLIGLAYRTYAQLGLGHPKFVSNPYPLYAKLREREPVRRDPLVPVWVVTSYDEVVTTLRDPRFRKETYLSDALPDALRERFDLPRERDAAVMGEPMAMLFLDPPRHTKLRGQFNKAFSASAMSKLRLRVEAIAGECIESCARSLKTDGTFDVIRELAYPLPTRVIADLLGFPRADYPKLKKWSDDFAAALTISPTPEQQRRSNASREEMRVYFNELVERMKRDGQASHAGEHLIGTLLAEGCGDSADFTREELFANSALIIAAGHETTTNLIGNGLLALLQHRDQLKLLRDDPKLLESAIEELLRYDSPVQWTARVAGEDLALGGKHIERGQIVLSSLGAANRDPSKFDDPDRLDISRKENRHVAFGYGIHYCLGAALARMEAQIAIGKLIARFPTMKLATRSIEWVPGLIFRGVKSLQIKA